MNNIFIDSLKHLIPGIISSDPVANVSASIHAHAHALNDFFGGNNFLTNCDCGLVPPVSVASARQKGEFKYLIFSLNPGYVDNFICDELGSALAAPSTWDSYADYYTNGSTFYDIIPGSPYYRNRIALIDGIENCLYRGWKEFRNNKNNDSIKEYVKEYLSDTGLVVADVIPFHSVMTAGFNIPALYASFPQYRKYHKYLIDSIIPRLNNDGLIIVDGKDAADTFLQLVAQHGGLLNRYDYDCNYNPSMRNPKITTGCYNGKKVVVLHEFIRRPNGCFNSDAQLTELVNFICQFKNTINC